MLLRPPSVPTKLTAHILRHTFLSILNTLFPHNNTDTLTNSNEKHTHFTQTHSLSFDLFCTCFVSPLCLSSMVEIHALNSNLATEKNDHSTDNASPPSSSLSFSHTHSNWLWLNQSVIESLGDHVHAHSCAQPLKLMHGIRRLFGCVALMAKTAEIVVLVWIRLNGPESLELDVPLYRGWTVRPPIVSYRIADNTTLYGYN